MNRLAAFAALTLLCLGLAAPGAAARKPIISYRDAGNMLRLYDAETGQDIAAPAIEIPGILPRYSMSLDGRYVVWADAAKDIHLFDRGSGAERSLPGINAIATDPNNLSVSSAGLIAFDENNNGPARVYDSAAGAFVDTGLDAANSHRQTRISGDGRFLATTCVPGVCEADQGADASAYVQDLSSKTDTGFPDDLAGDNDLDEEHPCIDADGSLVGIDIKSAVTMTTDIYLYDRSANSAVPLPGVNDAAKDDKYCVLDAAGDYLGYVPDAAASDALRVFERSTSSFLTLPPDRFNRFSVFSAPFPPPDDGGPGVTLRCKGAVATLAGNAGRNVLRGTPGRDVIAALGGNDTIRGRGGRDLICAGAGKDRAFGGGGADRILGGAGADLLDGAAGKDRLLGGAGRDRLLGRGGADLLNAGPGRDRCTGGKGNDRQRGCER